MQCPRVWVTVMAVGRAPWGTVDSVSSVTWDLQNGDLNCPWSARKGEKLLCDGQRHLTALRLMETVRFFRDLTQRLGFDTFSLCLGVVTSVEGTDNEGRFPVCEPIFRPSRDGLNVMWCRMSVEWAQSNCASGESPLRLLKKIHRSYLSNPFMFDSR